MNDEDFMNIVFEEMNIQYSIFNNVDNIIEEMSELDEDYLMIARLH